MRSRDGKRRSKGDVVYILCRSEGREQKDRAIREKHEAKWLADVEKLQAGWPRAV